MSKKCPIIINTNNDNNLPMGARSTLFFFLVAIITGLALIPSSNAEEQIEIVNISHEYVGLQNNLTVKIQNNGEEHTSNSLKLNIFSIDLQNHIALESPNRIFSIESGEEYQTDFEFTISLSGEYIFNISLISNDGNISYSYLEKKYIFFQNRYTTIENIIADYYLDIDGSNWKYDEQDKSAEINGLQGNFASGIVIGPFDTKDRENNKLILDTSFTRTNTSEFSISETNNFDSQQLYSTNWNELIKLDEKTPSQIVIEIDSTKEIFLKFWVEGENIEEENSWTIMSIVHSYISKKHHLEIETPEHYFYNTDQTPKIHVNVSNTGLFDQQTGNITATVKLFSENEIIDEYTGTISIASKEVDTIEFLLTGIDKPGTYYGNVVIKIVNEEIFQREMNFLLSISIENLGTYELDLDENGIAINSEYSKINLLINSTNIDGIEFNQPNEVNNLYGSIYLVKLYQNEGFLEISSNEAANYGRIISIISMDEYRFEAKSTSEKTETIEGITAPSVLFIDKEPYIINVQITNKGFYTENYEIKYIFANSFIEKIEAPNDISLSPGKTSSFEVEITPLENIPREGGSQFNIEITNDDYTQIVTYLLSYKDVQIEVLENRCNRHSVLVGQSIDCTIVVTNNGYFDGPFTMELRLNRGEQEVIERIDILGLSNDEKWTVRITHDLSVEGKYNIIININDESGTITTYETEQEITVVAPASQIIDDERNYNFQRPDLTFGVLTLSFLGFSYHLRRSENFKYFAFKFFIPLYSRLKPDTISDEPTRQNLLRHIYSEPGSNFTQIKEKFGLHNGTLAHHINILENHKAITSQRSGRQRLFFPYGTTKKARIRTSFVTNITQKEIIKIVKDNPGITQSMISQNLGISRQKVNYHVNSLVSNSILNIEKQGRITRLYPTHFT